MSSAAITTSLAALLCGAHALGVVLSRRRSIAAWLFAVGIFLFGLESALATLSIQETVPGNVKRWAELAVLISSFAPGIWLAFSMAYSRGDARSYLGRWRWLLLVVSMVPVAIAVSCRNNLIQEIIYREENGGSWWIRFGPAVKVLNLMGLAVSIAVLANIEKTFRAAIGTMQWRIKFVVLGVGAIFGARIYSGSQAFLFSAHELDLAVVEAAALIMGCILIAFAYARHGFGEIDIYPSGAVLRNSAAILLAGGYLIVVGALAQWAAAVGGIGNLHLQSMVVMGGVILLAVLLLSDRLRHRLRRFVSQHFKRPFHDSRAIWTSFTRGLSDVFEAREYSARTVKLLAETFDALSVTIWLFDDRMNQMVMGASTVALRGDSEDAAGLEVSKLLLDGLQKMPGPFDPDAVGKPWAESLAHISASHFPNGGRRICIPLFVGDRGLGFVMLADRVDGMPYLIEEMDLLKCIGDHVAAGLHQLRLTEELMQGRELAAFQSMSTFFVHDLKNAASSLSLMLENLPEHYDDPEFLQDAVRAIGGANQRINQIIGKLGTLRQKLELRPAEMDLNQLVSEAIGRMGGMGKIELSQNLDSLPRIRADRGQLENVVVNLLANAREAVGTGGKITVETTQRDECVVLSVADNGCGMTPTFLKYSLFRPFQTTKKKGLGIGMFQSRLIVEAHRGTMKVESESGRGTTFQVILPLTTIIS